MNISHNIRILFEASQVEFKQRRSYFLFFLPFSLLSFSLSFPEHQTKMCLQSLFRVGVVRRHSGAGVE
jgi:hypothetical protein